MIADSLREYWPVHLLLLLYTLVLAYHAWEGNRGTKRLADYYVGGRNMGGVTIALSFFATYSSTNSFVGFSGQSWAWGLPWLLLAPFIVMFSLIAWVWVAPRLRDFTAGLDSLTIPDFVGFRFGSDAARVLAAIIVIFASFFYMTAVFKGIGNLLETFLEIPYRAAIVIVFLIVMLYTVIGGFISVVKTDAVQGVVMVFAALLLFLGTTRAAGGVGSILALKSDPGTAHLFTWNGGEAFPLVLGVLVAGTIKFIVEPRQLSRFYALRGRREARTGVWISTLLFAAVYTMLVPIGMYARRVLPGGLGDTDLVVPGLLTEPGVFAPGVAAFLLVAMVAAAMSSLDSVLLVMASTCQRDIFGVWRGQRDERAAMRRTKWYVALFAAVTAVISLNPPAGVVALTAFSGAMYAACFFPAVILGLHWRRGNGASAVASFLVGLGVLVIWRLTPLGSVLHEVFPALALSLLAYVLVARLTSPPTAPHKVETLFKKADRRGRRRSRRRSAARAKAMRTGVAALCVLGVGPLLLSGSPLRGQDAAPERAEYRLYVANESSDIVSRVVFRPGAGVEVEKEIPVGIMPADNDGAHGLAVSPDGAFWYLTIAHGTPRGHVWKFAAGPDTLVGRAELGLFPATMGITPNGRFLVAANFNLHGDRAPSDLSVVYTPTMTQLARVVTCVMPHGSRVSASGARQYSACMHSDQLVEFDLAAMEVSRRFSVAPGHEGPLDPSARGVAGHGAELRATGRAGSAGESGGGRAAAGGTVPGGGVAAAEATSADGGAADGATTEPSGMDGGADMAAEPVPACSPTWAEPGAGELADRVVYVACNGNDEILEIDAQAWEVRRRFPTGRAPYNLEVAADGSLLVATLKGGQAVAVISLDSGEEIARLATTQPVTHGVVASPDGRYAFVSNEAVGSTPGTLDVFDLETLERVASTPLRYQPGGIDFWRATIP